MRLKRVTFLQIFFFTNQYRSVNRIKWCIFVLSTKQRGFFSFTWRASYWLTCSHSKTSERSFCLLFLLCSKNSAFQKQNFGWNRTIIHFRLTSRTKMTHYCLVNRTRMVSFYSVHKTKIDYIYSIDKTKSLMPVLLS